MGEADFILAFEELEGARCAGFLSAAGILIVNTRRILPMPVVMGAAMYPEDPLKAVRENRRVFAMDALQMAVQAGSARAVNLVLLGALAHRLPWDRQAWTDAIKESVPPMMFETNLRAFGLGYTGIEKTIA
jgi:indolepyruvate ferredoxin oxidoreductase beta subunit